jgi:hypothetical protein
MAKFDFDRHASELASRDVHAMRNSVSSHTFYLVEETANSSGAGYDPIYGEAFDAFTSASQVSSTLNIPFIGSIISRGESTELYRQGFFEQKKMTVDVSTDTVLLQNIQWQAGLLIMFQGDRYRLTSVDTRGIRETNRIILYMDEVT